LERLCRAASSEEVNSETMSLTKRKWFRILLGPALVLFAWIIQYNSYRATAAVLFLLLVISYIYFLFTAKSKWLRLILVAFVIAAFLPIDVTLKNYPGPPRFVRLIIGSPTDDDSAREARGEVVLGGCILRDNPPRWVLVW